MTQPIFWILLALLSFSACLTPQLDHEQKDNVTPRIVQPQRTRFWYNIPARASHAITGSFFMMNTKKLSAKDREKEILKQLRRGNVPDFMRNFQPINFSHSLRGKVVYLTIWVTPDYLSIGSDRDFVRVPMNPLTAQKVADQYGVMLPTKKIVDLIYHHAQVKLSPATMTPGPQMGSNDYFKNHHDTIERSLASNYRRTSVIAGHKKDVVISNRLNEKRGRVAIYGWHRAIGNPIQPLSIVHDQYYADYSHGIRFIAPTMLMNGQEIPIAEVLEDPSFASLLSDEGVIYPLRVRTE